MKNPFIIGKKTYLRPIDADDIDQFVTWLNDEEVRQYLSIATPFNNIREREWVDNLYKDNSNIILGIVVKESNKHIGNIGLHKISTINRHAELGIFIGDKDSWSKGYGTEAIKLIVDYGFNQLNLHRIYLEVLDFNKRAERSYEKAGFNKEGTNREHIFKNGKYCDLHIMSILRTEWENGASIKQS